MSKSEAMIWGAGGAIGTALRDRLEQEGWKVTPIVHNLNEKNIEGAVEADAGNPASVQAALVEISQRVDRVDLWIYAAGDITHSELASMESEAWQEIIDANLTGPFLSLKESLPLLTEDATIMIIGAQQERLRLPGLSAYAAAKAGLEAMVATLRKEQRGRQVILIRPSAVHTSFWEKVPFSMPKSALEPSELADAIFAAYQDGPQGVLDF
jgi:NAD(P)-dependent dehydrogenase (short-subunit alcohol dehydrogenase family)